MRGSVNNKLFAHYNIYIDKDFIGSGFTSKNDSIYKYTIKNSGISNSKYVLINFDNDKFTDNEDRNLYVSDVQINSKAINLMAIDIFFLKSNSQSGKALISELYSIKNYLSDLGIDTLKIKVVKSNSSSHNNTLTLANTARKYFLTTNIKNVNVITPDFHSRRSYLNFKNCLKNVVEIGCIPMKTEKKKRKRLNKIDDRVSLLFTFLYWGFH